MGVMIARRRVRIVAAMGVFHPLDVPQAEAGALIAFYKATGGANWTNNTGWLSDRTVNNWNGVTVAGGHVTQIGLAANNLVGAAGATLAPLAGSLTLLSLYDNSITTIVLSLLTALTTLYLGDNSLTALDISTLTALTSAYCYGNAIATLDLSALADGASYIDAKDNGMAQAAVDAMIGDIWTRKDDWSDATPELHVGGTNAAPTGAYQDGYPLPITTLEEVHDLINDDGAAGIQTWAAISWNGGTAP